MFETCKKPAKSRTATSTSWTSRNRLAVRSALLILRRRVPIADFLHGRLPTSVAAGELPAAIRQRHLDWVDRFTFVKAGPAGISEIDEYARVWRQWLAQIPTGVQPVAVAYADWNAADCIRPTEILQAIASTRATGLLIDTCHKDYGLFEILSIEEIENLLQQANRRNIWVALAAGSLCGDSVEKAIQVGPRIVAVRGAVCRGDRTDSIDGDLVDQLATRVHQFLTPSER